MSHSVRQSNANAAPNHGAGRVAKAVKLLPSKVPGVLVGLDLYNLIIL